MTNLEIIEAAKYGLYEEGKLTLIDGFIEDIHTYARWKALGYAVRSGEHAVAKFKVWKPCKTKKKSEIDDEENKDVEIPQKLILVSSAFFSQSQVEKI